MDVLSEPAISYEGLCDRLEERRDLKLTPQALCERVNSAGAVRFLEAALTKTLCETAGPPLACHETAWLAPFSRVLLQDSTQIEVHESLSEIFKGSGGNASSASVKIDYSVDVKAEKTEHLALRQGADSDQGFANDLAARVQAGDLVIRDLGYFCLGFFVHVATTGAYFLSRLRFNVNLYPTADADAPLQLIRHIHRFGGGAAVMEFPLFLGEKQRLPVRLVAYRLPPDVYRKRQKAALKTAKRKGRRVSLSYLKLLKYAFYISNVPQTLWPKEAFGTIYRLRWQVELTFKHWKSLFRIDLLKGMRPERIRCLLYGRLIIILIVQRLLALASAEAKSQEQEVSFYKTIQWLLRNERFVKAFVARQFGQLVETMLSRLKRLLKAKRKRRTTQQLIAQQRAYLDSFSDLEASSCEGLIFN